MQRDGKPTSNSSSSSSRSSNSSSSSSSISKPASNSSSSSSSSNIYIPIRNNVVSQFITLDLKMQCKRNRTKLALTSRIIKVIITQCLMTGAYRIVDRSHHMYRSAGQSK